MGTVATEVAGYIGDELFGFARLAASSSHWSTRAPTADAVAGGIWEDLTAWCGGESHHDDMTLLVLRVTELDERGTPRSHETAG